MHFETFCVDCYFSITCQIFTTTIVVTQMSLNR